MKPTKSDNTRTLRLTTAEYKLLRATLRDIYLEWEYDELDVHTERERVAMDGLMRKCGLPVPSLEK